MHIVLLLPLRAELLSRLSEPYLQAAWLVVLFIILPALIFFRTPDTKKNLNRAVAAADELAETAQSREVRLEVVLQRRSVVQGARDYAHDAVRQSEQFVEVFGGFYHFLVALGFLEFRF